MEEFGQVDSAKCPLNWKKKKKFQSPKFIRNFEKEKFRIGFYKIEIKLLFSYIVDKQTLQQSVISLVVRVNRSTSTRISINNCFFLNRLKNHDHFGIVIPRFTRFKKNPLRSGLHIYQCSNIDWKRITSDFHSAKSLALEIF